MGQPPSPSLRLTRRGRLAVTVGVSAALLGVVAVTGGGSPAGDDRAAARSVPAPTASAQPPPGPAPTPQPQPTSAGTSAVREVTPVEEEEVSRSGSGELVTVEGSAEPTAASGRLLAYRVRVEDGLTVSGQAVDAAQFARLVHEILTDDRGWQGVEGVRFARVDDGPADVEVVLASPDTTDRLCAPLQTAGALSCFNGTQAVINARRWFASDDSYGGDLTGYRRYLISHEVGHDLGYGHVGCPEPGALAPVMMQQTKSLDGCLPNPWPNPPDPAP